MQRHCHSAPAPPSLKPEDPLAVAALRIMKAVQSLIGEFPHIELGGVAERPEALRKWRFAMRTALEAAGPHVTTWWDGCWAAAEQTHAVYMQAPVMSREGLKVAQRPSSRYAQLEAWLKPRVVAAMPQIIKRQLTARGVQGIRGDTPDVLRDVRVQLAKSASA